MFALTQSEQRLVIIVMIALVIGTWIKHHRDMNLGNETIPTVNASPVPQPNDN